MTELDTSQQAPTTSVDAASAGDADDALVSRLRLIEDQALETRADAFTQIHDELRAVLEGGDAAAR